MEYFLGKREKNKHYSHSDYTAVQDCTGSPCVRVAAMDYSITLIGSRPLAFDLQRLNLKEEHLPCS